MKNPTKSNRTAFTLAEVLITLGIIGVVAALTIPALVTKTKNKELETAFKKAYSVLTQSVLLIQADNDGNFTEDQYTFTRSFKKVLKEKFKGMDCKKYDINWTDPNRTPINCMTYDTFKYKTYSGQNSAYGVWFDDGQFITPDGMLFMIQNSSMGLDGPGGDKPLAISVDVNGLHKPPNQWGHDVFTFQVYKGRIMPMGVNESLYSLENFPNYCSGAKNNREIRNGINCTVNAAYQKDYFKNLPRN